MAVAFEIVHMNLITLSSFLIFALVLLSIDFGNVRAGLSKLLNSLSSNAQIVLPRVVDTEYQTISAIRLSDYGWTNSTWQAILRCYPYAIQLPGRTAANVYEQLGTNIPHLRADWFFYTAARPPLHHEILEIPNNAQALEKSLGINVQQNFIEGKTARAAIQKSGVSQQNRLVERLSGTGGASVRYYWKSYDMKPNKGDVGILTLRPLIENATGTLAKKVQRIYSRNQEMQRLMQRDREDFLRANREAIAAFLATPNQDATALDNFPDPITRGAPPYRLTVSIETAARELGIEAADKHQSVRQLPELFTLGLGTPVVIPQSNTHKHVFVIKVCSFLKDHNLCSHRNKIDIG